MSQIVQHALENVKAGRSAAAQTDKNASWCKQLRRWSDIVFLSTSHLFFNLKQAGVPESDVLTLLPYLRKPMVNRNFQLLTDNRQPQKSVRSPRLRAFALGLFSHHWARHMEADIQRRFGVTKHLLLPWLPMD